MQLQFGCSYSRHFELGFLRYLKSVISYYPAVRLSPVDSGEGGCGCAG